MPSSRLLDSHALRTYKEGMASTMPRPDVDRAPANSRAQDDLHAYRVGEHKSHKDRFRAALDWALAEHAETLEKLAK